MCANVGILYDLHKSFSFFFQYDVKKWIKYNELCAKNAKKCKKHPFFYHKGKEGMPLFNVPYLTSAYFLNSYLLILHSSLTNGITVQPLAPWRRRA